MAKQKLGPCFADLFIAEYSGINTSYEAFDIMYEITNPGDAE